MTVEPLRDTGRYVAIVATITALHAVARALAWKNTRHLRRTA